MSAIFAELFIFTLKGFLTVIFIAIILLIFFGLLFKGKNREKNKLIIKNVNKKYVEMTHAILEEMSGVKKYKKVFKDMKKQAKRDEDNKSKNIFVLTFNGDIKASNVNFLADEISAVLSIATPDDLIILRLESVGGVVHGYGLAAAQLIRIRERKIPLYVFIDKVAASGGYLMACVADRIFAAPFAIVGSIGVVIQLPNFHRFLKNKDIDFEQLTAGKYKRTITIFGENSEEGREKLQQEIENVHGLFKMLIMKYRKSIDIDKVATGEYWLGEQAIGLNLIDDIKTSEDYLHQESKHAHIYEICHETKKSMLTKLTGATTKLLGLT